MRLALLHTRLSGYLAACLREFKARTDAELLIYAWPAQTDAPFDAAQFADLGEVRNRREVPNEAMREAVVAFRPGAILTSGWADKGYLKVCRAMRQSGLPVIAGCDTQWTGSVRQHIGSWIAPWQVRRAIDVLWITGERQAVLGRALGYSGNRLWEGYYACDWEAFAWDSAAGGSKESSGPFFLYVGRYVPEKGLDTLADAYWRYRNQGREPWRFVCAGTGPLRDMLLEAGAEDRGFVQPSALPTLMHNASAFVLPSRFEPWGVVVQEAAASSLPLILSDACGAGVHLLRHLYNGYSFPAGDAQALANSLMTMHRLAPERRKAFGQASFDLSKQYTPERWAETLVEGLALLKANGA